MLETLLTILRDKQSTTGEFRLAVKKLGCILAAKSGELLSREVVAIETPLAATHGIREKNPIALVPILRAGLALLPAFLEFFEDSKVGFIGIRREESTAKPLQYYENLPHFAGNEEVIILDPMIATGGSALKAIERLKAFNVPENKIILVGIVAAPEGLRNLAEHAPMAKIVTAAIDEHLSPQKFIIPGLGDFGDRFFLT